MITRLFSWLGGEFIALSTEGSPGESAAEAAQGIFTRFDETLRGLGLTLECAVRTRLWTTDRESRDRASDVRFKRLSGAARASSSSFIAPDRFQSDARVALDMIAMKPPRPGGRKTVVEYDPPKRPCRYVAVDGFVFLTGEESKKALRPVLADQWREIYSLLTDTLAQAGASWAETARVSCFLHRSQDPAALRAMMANDVKTEIPFMEIAWVDDYALPGGLLEVEVTAKRR
ncbi:MAG TPA: hypothetical protein VGB25_06265 [Candidatus Binatia bacterium]